MENNLDGLKQLVKLAIDVNVPQILKIKDDIEETTRQKKELQSQIDALKNEIENQIERLLQFLEESYE